MNFHKVRMLIAGGFDAEGDGRRDAWLPGPTARDEGPRPGAEGGAR